ncbi:hypothetical protein ERO13_D01G136250v2 [Gossypium hirsutum]|nr:hypothetical protein ERO13_D01G136250v2 [Gossypium hirsutum]
MCCVIRQSSDIGKGYCLFVSSRLRRECICNIIAWVFNQCKEREREIGLNTFSCE